MSSVIVPSPSPPAQYSSPSSSSVSRKNKSRKRKTPDDTTPVNIAPHIAKRDRKNATHLEFSKNSVLDIIFVTGNAGKLREVQEFLGPDLGKYLQNFKMDLKEIQSSTTQKILSDKLEEAVKIVERIWRKANPKVRGKKQETKENPNKNSSSSDGPSNDESKNENKNKNENENENENELLPTQDIWILVEDTALSFDVYGANSNFPGPFIKFAIKSGAETLVRAHQGLKDGERGCTAICTFGLQKIFSKHDPIFIEGQCHGEISRQLLGDNGFGWDPMFLHKKSGKTFAQMTTAEKNEISHRADALQRLKPEIKKIVEAIEIDHDHNHNNNNNKKEQ